MNYLNMGELEEVLECMTGTYPVNEQLIDRISLKFKRKGLKSICFGLS